MTKPLTIKDVTLDITFGGWFIVSAMVNNYRVKRHYLDYTARESIDMFLTEVNQQLNERE